MLLNDDTGYVLDIPEVVHHVDSENTIDGDDNDFEEKVIYTHPSLPSVLCLFSKRLGALFTHIPWHVLQVNNPCNWHFMSDGMKKKYV